MAADADRVVRVGQDGMRTEIADANDVPFNLRADAAGGIMFMDHEGENTTVYRAASGQKVTTVATGKIGALGLSAQGGGKLVITGSATKVNTLPNFVSKLDVPVDAEISTNGDAAVSKIQLSGQPVQGKPQAVHIVAKSVGTGKDLGFTVTPSAAPSPTTFRIPKAATPNATPKAPTANSVTVDQDRVCAVPRNDPNIQVYQPKPKQVEWAADLAVQNVLTTPRPLDWHHNGIGAYVPQQMFPSIGLKNTNGGRVPAQVLLGILGQESNLWQATSHVLPGEYGNPLVGNYYGVDIYNDKEDDDWAINWANADCGYGVSQMTDGMRLAGHERPGEVALPHEQQIAIGTDYAANVAAGLRVLQSKWNQMQDAHMTLNDNDPSKIENWFFAVWAYNSGYHNPGEAGSNGAYGLGWGNNPANPHYSPDRHQFGFDPHDFAHPQGWPYEEKVLGFAANPPAGYELPGMEVPFFRAAWWNGTDGDENTVGSAKWNRKNATPTPFTFCTVDANTCDKNGKYPPEAKEVVGEPAGPCAHKNTDGKYDLKCWWHSSAAWKNDCSYSCGNEFVRYDPGLAEPADGASYPPKCDVNGLPNEKLFVNDVDDQTKPVEDPKCNGIPANNGAFTFAFGKDANGLEASKIDLHQDGGGLGAHFWFSHTNADGPLGQALKITGTWTFAPVYGVMNVQVFIPDHLANATTANYVVHAADKDYTVPLSQAAVTKNNWASLGNFRFSGTPVIELSNIAAGANGASEIAWDAMEIQFPYAAPVANEYPWLIYNGYTGKCLSTAGAGDAATPVPVQNTCAADNSMPDEWITRFVGSPPNQPNEQLYQIVSRGYGKCIGISDVNGANTQPAKLVPCNSSDPTQVWDTSFEFQKESTARIYIMNRQYGRCLFVPNHSSADGQVIMTTMDDCNWNSPTAPDSSHEWHLER
jgi:hypothetical protein